MVTGVSALGPRFYQSTNILSQMQPYSGSRARLLRLGHVRRTGIPHCPVSPMVKPERTVPLNAFT